MTVQTTGTATLKTPRWCQFVLRMLIKDGYDAFISDTLVNFSDKVNKKSYNANPKTRRNYATVSKTYAIPNSSTLKLKIQATVLFEFGGEPKLCYMKMFIKELNGCSEISASKAFDDALSFAFESQLR